MGLSPQYHYTGGSRGWIGDVPKMQLDISRLRTLDMSLISQAGESVRIAVRAALSNMKEKFCIILGDGMADEPLASRD